MLFLLGSATSVFPDDGKVPGTHKALTLVEKKTQTPRYVTHSVTTLGGTSAGPAGMTRSGSPPTQGWFVNHVTHRMLLLPAQNPMISLKRELSGIGNNAGSCKIRAGSCWSQTDTSRAPRVSELHCLLHQDHRTEPQLHVSYHTENYLNALR